MEALLQPLDPRPIEYIYSIVIFANLESGGKLGRRIKNSQVAGCVMQVKSIELTEISNTSVHFYIINEQKSRGMGISYLKRLCEDLDMKTNRIVALAGGGDGTVNWLLSELIKEEIDFSKVIFGAFALGTGNDFAKNLGWREYSLFSDNFSDLHSFVVEIEQAEIEQFNVWDVEVVAHEDRGYIVKERHRDGVIYMVNQQTEPNQKHLLKRFTNYFSFGMDARVGFDFNRHRSQKQIINYILYFLIGCFNRFRAIEDITDIVTKMEMENEDAMPLNEQPRRKMTQVLFTKESAVGVKEKYRNIVAMNINYYMGGVPDIWRHAYRNGANLIDKGKQYRENSHSDGIIEFISFQNEWSLGYERYIRGRARRMAQGTGPFRFEFEPNCAFTYLNFDGEYYKVVKPKEVIVRHSSHFEKVPLRVLRHSRK